MKLEQCTATTAVLNSISVCSTDVVKHKITRPKGDADGAKHIIRLFACLMKLVETQQVHLCHIEGILEPIHAHFINAKEEVAKIGALRKEIQWALLGN